MPCERRRATGNGTTDLSEVQRIGKQSRLLEELDALLRAVVEELGACANRNQNSSVLNVPLAPSAREAFSSLDLMASSNEMAPVAGAAVRSEERGG